MSCINENCNNNPLDSPDAICVSCDGDFVCNEHCKMQYEMQRDRFFNVICQSEELTEEWLLGRIDNER